MSDLSIHEKDSFREVGLLPVADCRKEFNPLTGRHEFIAPTGFVFEIRGDLLARRLGGSFKLRNPDENLSYRNDAFWDLRTARVLRGEEEGAGERMSFFRAKDSGPRLLENMVY